MEESKGELSQYQEIHVQSTKQFKSLASKPHVASYQIMDRIEKIESILNGHSKEIESATNQIKEFQKSEFDNLRKEISSTKELEKTSNIDINLRLDKIENQNTEILQKLSDLQKENQDNYICIMRNISFQGLENNILIKDDEKEFIVKLFQQTRMVSFTKIYQATINGGSAEKFHEYCDSYSPTLVIILTDKGVKFGGFTYCSWKDEKAKDQCDENAFLFNVGLKKKYVMRKDQGLKSIKVDPHMGPCFGEYGNDILIRDNFLESDYNLCGPSDENKSYNSVYTCSNREINNFKKNFKVAELEVYHVQIYKK